MMNTNFNETKECLFSEIYNHIINDKYPYHYIAEFDICNMSNIMKILKMKLIIKDICMKL